MSKITIIKGEEFKIAVKEKITQDDLFIEQYERAANMLDKIIGTSIGIREKDLWSWKSQDFENNIIAFCGERGEGKSSVMITFVNAVYKDRGNDIFSKCMNLKNTYFTEPILIDPSLFDDVHNVLDIVVAKIFKKFYEYYNNDNQYVDERTRENLLNRFQRVYRYVSLINNQKQMLDDEFDYEGNISKLTKLGESTNLKEDRKYLHSLSGICWIWSLHVEKMYILVWKRKDKLESCTQLIMRGKTFLILQTVCGQSMKRYSFVI